MTAYRDQLQGVFREVFGDDDIELREEMTAVDFDGWDSLQHISLMIAIETSFNVRFATAEISNLKNEGANIGTMLTLLKEKLERP